MGVVHWEDNPVSIRAADALAGRGEEERSDRPKRRRPDTGELTDIHVKPTVFH